jgi:multidrug efflux pump subunit AcrB
VALTVVPLFCARFIKSPHGDGAHGSIETRVAAAGAKQDPHTRPSLWARFNVGFAAAFEGMLKRYDRMVTRVLEFPRGTLAMFGIFFLLSLLLFPLLGLSFFPRTDAAQFVISFKAPSGTKLEATEQETVRLENLVRRVVAKEDMGMIVSNLGVDPGFSSLFSPNSAMHTGFTQVALSPEHRKSSFAYIDEVKRAVGREMPELQTFFSSGSLVDGVLNMGAPAPIDIRVVGNDMTGDFKVAQGIAARVRKVRGVADVYIPQDLDYPSLRISIAPTSSPR